MTKHVFITHGCHINLFMLGECSIAVSPGAGRSSTLIRATAATMSNARYSFSLTTFSPTGKLMQIEYALKAVSQGRTSLGIQGRSSRTHTHKHAHTQLGCDSHTRLLHSLQPQMAL